MFVCVFFESRLDDVDLNLEFELWARRCCSFHQHWHETQTTSPTNKLIHDRRLHDRTLLYDLIYAKRSSSQVLLMSWCQDCKVKLLHMTMPMTWQFANTLISIHWQFANLSDVDTLCLGAIQYLAVLPFTTSLPTLCILVPRFPVNEQWVQQALLLLQDSQKSKLCISTN